MVRLVSQSMLREGKINLRHSCTQEARPRTQELYDPHHNTAQNFWVNLKLDPYGPGVFEPKQS